MSVQPEFYNKCCGDSSYHAISDGAFNASMYDSISKRYPGTKIVKSDENNAAYVYEYDNRPTLIREIAFIQSYGNLTIIILKGIMRRNELTDGGLRVLNNLNSERYLITHMLDTKIRVYKCRCIVPSNLLNEDFDNVMEYIEREYIKAKTLLSMECR